MTKTEKKAQRVGSCLCGGVSFRVSGPLTDTSACHCSQCRKMTGSYLISTNAKTEDMRIERSETLAWYASSSFAERGFCNRCGSTLFWREKGGDHVSIACGAFDGPSGVAIERHIFVADKGDYYVICDDKPQFDTH